MQHAAEQHRVTEQEVAQLVRKRHHPLTHRHLREGVLDEEGGGLALLRAREPSLKVLLYEPIERGALGAAGRYTRVAAVRIAELRYAGRAEIRVRP
ncbi:MAG: hypothetical protein ACREVI_10215 [Steroidobacteraceae bacterium]